MNVWVDIRSEIALIWSLVKLGYANMAAYLEGSKVNWVIRTTQGVVGYPYQCDSYRIRVKAVGYLE